jgi:hypothetical protein
VVVVNGEFLRVNGEFLSFLLIVCAWIMGNHPVKNSLDFCRPSSPEGIPAMGLMVTGSSFAMKFTFTCATKFTIGYSPFTFYP